MEPLPSGLLRGHDVPLAIVDQQDFFSTEPDRCLNFGEEVRIRLLCSKHRRIEDAIDTLSQTQSSHHIGSS